MEYRCPYCGKEAFSLRVKLGIVSKFGTALRCPHCKRVSERKAAKGGNFGYYLILIFAALISMGCFVLAFTYQILGLIPIGLLLFFLIYLLSNYFFCHFDKIYSKERKADPVFIFESSTNEKLWPTIRQGEIYILQIPQKGIRESNSPKIIGLIDKMDHKNGKWIFNIRVINPNITSEIAVGASVRMVTNGMLVVPGIISSTHNKNMSEPLDKIS